MDKLRILILSCAIANAVGIALVLNGLNIFSWATFIGLCIIIQGLTAAIVSILYKVS